VYALSQALSIAVNSLLLKLALTMSNQIPSSYSEQWLNFGFLLVFEGLLSVVKHERSMLEDTISAIDGLRSFQVRILPMEEYRQQNDDTARSMSNDAEWLRADRSATRATTPPPSAAHAEDSDTDSDDELNAERHSIAAAATAAVASGRSSGKVLTGNVNDSGDNTGGGSTGGNNSGTYTSDFNEMIEVTMNGREVTIYMMESMLAKLPPIYSQKAYAGGAVIKLFSVLFTQVRSILAFSPSTLN
jgi:hypothetical protein